MDMDLNKLGKLIEKCKDSGVSKLEIKEGNVIAEFFDQKPEKPVDIDLTQFPSVKFNHVTQGDDEEKEPQILNQHNYLDEDDMLHLVDPVAWEKKAQDESEERFSASGGDERELAHV